MSAGRWRAGAVASALLLAPLSAGAPLQEPPPLARVCSVRMDAGWRITEVVLHDVDGDGNADLVLATARAQAKDAQARESSARRVRVHLRKSSAPSFAAAPDLEVELPRDVVAWAISDVHADAGDELVLFSSSALFALRWRASESERFVRLAAIEFLWQRADPETAFAWQDGVVDVDGDGREDLVVPGAGFERVLFQDRDAEGRASFERAFDLNVGEMTNAGAVTGASKSGDGARAASFRQPGGRRRVEVSFDGGGLSLDARAGARGKLLEIHDSVPAGQFLDWDGDGDRDALFLMPEQLLVFRQEPRGSFAPVPLALTSPLVRDRARELDVSFEAWSRDLDSDHQADLLFSAGDRRAKEPRTQLLVFSGARKPEQAWDSSALPLFGKDGVPRQLLVLAGFARLVSVRDVDGDGKDDLVALSLKPDLLSQVRASTSDSVETELYVFRGLGGTFEKRPALSERVTLSAAGADRVLRFAGDVTGDGIAELFIRDQKQRVSVRTLRRARDGALALPSAALWTWPIDADARVVLPTRLGPGSWDLVAWTGGEASCASFR